MKKIMLALATGLGLGLSPFAPGTVGTLLGIPLAFLLAQMTLGWQIFWVTVLCIAAIPVCDAGERELGRKDDRRIVADEYLTFPLCLLGLPWMDAGHWWLLAVAFVVNRVLDIIKPPPARQAQSLAGGLGIVADDVASGLYALAVNHLIWWAVRALTRA